MYEREKLMSDKLIHKLTKTWQPSLNILPVNSYIGDRDNRYITVNRAQASAILRAGLPIDIFMRQTPIDMPGIIESKNLGMEKQTITPVWKTKPHSSNSGPLVLLKYKSPIASNNPYSMIKKSSATWEKVWI